MATNPPAGYSRITPYLLYEDAAAALDWLARAFGFRERFRHEADGLIDHAEMEYGGSEIMLASPGNDYRSPGRLGGATVIVHMYVDDIQAHCQRARDAGATIRREPKEKPYGTIQYAAVDPEGHVWLFSQQVRDPEPEWVVTAQPKP
jgi:PhnB protein